MLKLMLYRILCPLSHAQQMGFNNGSLLPLPGSLSMSSDQLKLNIASMISQFGPACDERLAVLQYQFAQLENLLLPAYTR